VNKNQCKSCATLSICEEHKAGGKVTEEQDQVKMERKLLIDIRYIPFRLDIP
jgi:hypothetical protein